MQFQARRDRMHPVFVTLELHFAPGTMETFLTQLPGILEETRRTDGFVAISAHRHHEDADRLILSEQWHSALAYQTYLQSRIVSGLFTDLSKLLVAEPRIDIWQPAHLTVTAPVD